jgi:hypothetical protein
MIGGSFIKLTDGTIYTFDELSNKSWSDKGRLAWSILSRMCQNKTEGDFTDYIVYIVKNKEDFTKTREIRQSDIAEIHSVFPIRAPTKSLHTQNYVPSMKDFTGFCNGFLSLRYVKVNLLGILPDPDHPELDYMLSYCYNLKTIVLLGFGGTNYGSYPGIVPGVNASELGVNCFKQNPKLENFLMFNPLGRIEFYPNFINDSRIRFIFIGEAYKGLETHFIIKQGAFRNPFTNNFTSSDEYYIAVPTAGSAECIHLPSFVTATECEGTSGDTWPTNRDSTSGVAIGVPNNQLSAFQAKYANVPFIGYNMY